ncbi:MAG: DUF6282 family protein [Desulfobacterales bacterium]
MNPFPEPESRPKKFSPLLKGAIDLHVHAAPDVVARKQDLLELARDAADAGMAGMLIKDHCTSTVGRVLAVNRLYPQGPRFYSALALNPPSGGLNPVAAEAFLRAGGRVVFAPTYGAAHHIAVWGAGRPPTAFPLPPGFTGIRLLDESGALAAELPPILELAAQHDAVLATGHVSPEEALALLRAARRAGVRRLAATHVSEPVCGMDLARQREAVGLGALVEHCLFALTPACPGSIGLEEMARSIRSLGVEHVVLSSDFGQVSNPPAVYGLGDCLERLQDLGFSTAEIKTMVSDNPRRLLE